MRVIDVRHLGRPHVIGCWEVEGALVDPGPESSIETVLEAIDDEQPRALLLTHIHLDHAAATGALVRRWPDLEVYVHERGAPHLVDPSKLLASAERLYGDRLNYLWGEILPVPEQNVRALSGGETVLGMRVAYTPGLPPTTSVTSTTTAAPPSSATSPLAGSRPRTSSSPPRRRRTSTSRHGKGRWTRSPIGRHSAWR